METYICYSAAITFDHKYANVTMWLTWKQTYLPFTLHTFFEFHVEVMAEKKEIINSKKIFETKKITVSKTLLKVIHNDVIINQNLTYCGRLFFANGF